MKPAVVGEGFQNRFEVKRPTAVIDRRFAEKPFYVSALRRQRRYWYVENADALLCRLQLPDFKGFTIRYQEKRRSEVVGVRFALPLAVRQGFTGPFCFDDKKRGVALVKRSVEADEIRLRLAPEPSLLKNDRKFGINVVVLVSEGGH